MSGPSGGSGPRLERLVVIGAGAVGGSIGALVHAAGLPVVLVARGRHGEALRRGGLELALPEGRRRVAVPTDELLARVAAVRALPVDGRARAGGSTWQSRARGRPLETPFLEGALAELAREVGVPAPVNAFLARAARDPRPLRAADVLAAPT